MQNQCEIEKRSEAGVFPKIHPNLLIRSSLRVGGGEYQKRRNTIHKTKEIWFRKLERYMYMVGGENQKRRNGGSFASKIINGVEISGRRRGRGKV